jgi:GNAT superfamily N-acetyltransferase
MTTDVREMTEGDSGRLVQAFAGTPWALRGVDYFERLLAEHRLGARVVLVGLVEGEVAGHSSVVWQSAYPPFRDRAIPEIQDLNVVPRFRRRGLASRILDKAERIASQRSAVVGIGFGVHPGYRAAHRLYPLRGYVPDGNGIFRAGRFPQEGEEVPLDDELVLYLTKELSTEPKRTTRS